MTDRSDRPDPRERGGRPQERPDSSRERASDSRSRDGSDRLLSAGLSSRVSVLGNEPTSRYGLGVDRVSSATADSSSATIDSSFIADSKKLASRFGLSESKPSLRYGLGVDPRTLAGNNGIRVGNTIGLDGSQPSQLSAKVKGTLLTMARSIIDNTIIGFGKGYKQGSGGIYGKVANGILTAVKENKNVGSAILQDQAFSASGLELTSPSMKDATGERVLKYVESLFPLFAPEEAR